MLQEIRKQQREKFMKKISVVIPTYGRAQMVCDCVKSVLDTGYPNLEVIVVDDCSPDNTGTLVSERFGANLSVRYVRNDKNSLPAYSRNHGASYASGDIIFFLDDDNVVHQDIFVELLVSFDRHPKAGLVAPIACDMHNGRRRVWTIGSYFNPWTSQCADRCPKPEFVDDIPDDVTEYPTLYSPNAFAVTREVYDMCGGFDEVMRMMYEESDFGWRAVKVGFKAYISAKARTDHYGYLDPKTTPILRRLAIGRPVRAFTFARNRLIFARRHFSFLQSLVVAMVFAPLSAVYYGWVAVKNGRIDIAASYCAGTVIGILGLYPKTKFNCKAGSSLSD